MHLSNTNGLSQSSVIAIHQDNLGQIWIGTRDGLNKYDGTKFTIYRNEVYNPNSISNNDILSIKQDSEGFIWIGTHNGLNKFNPRTNAFTRYFHNQNDSSISNNTVWTIEELSNGEIWLGTSNGLSIYNKKTNTFKSFLQSKNGNEDNAVLSIYEMPNKNVFVGTTKGLSELINRDIYNLKFKTIPNTEQLNIQDLVESPNKTLLIATKTKSVLEFNLKTKSISNYLNDNEFEDGDENVRQLLFENNQKLWVGTYNGLKIVDENKNITLLRADINNPKSLSKSSIKTLYKDKKGSIWIGTYYGGVNIWDDSNINFLNITQSQIGKGLSYDVVSSIETSNELLFFGTEGGGITIFNKKTKTYTYINKESTKFLFDNNIKSLFLSKNKLWIGTFYKGVQVYNLSTKNFDSVILSSKLKDYLNDVGVYSIKQDNNQNMWFGTFGKGLVKYNLITKEFVVFSFSNNSHNSLSNNLIRTVTIDSNNNIWVGSEKGLNKIDVNGHIKTYFYDMNLQYGDDILSIFESSSKDIWLGTKAKGLFKLQDSNFIPIDLSDNHNRVSSVHSILEDNNRLLWISTNQGVVRFNTQKNDIKIYNQKDGLISNEFNDNAGLKIGGSQFYFGGPSGITYFNSNSLTTNKYTPRVILTDFTIKNKIIQVDDENLILKKTLPFTEAVELSYNQGNFSIYFSIPNFINSNNNTYKYRLKGLEEEWNLTSNNIASYTIQNSGYYVFQVTGANSDGIWNETITELKIEVAPAPWRSWWAILIYGMLISGILYFLIHISKSKSKLKHELELELIETDRAKEVNKTKLEFFTNISHEFRTPLALILGPLNQIIHDYKGSNKMYKKLLVVQSSANHLLHLINRLMDFRKFEKNLYKLEAAEGNIIKFLKEIYFSFTEYAKSGNYEFNFNTEEDEILLFYDRYKLERVFYNLISNAFRYTPKNGKIAISVTKDIESIIIQVEDTGVGIAEEYRDKIFERFFEVSLNNKPDNNYDKGTGIGLSIAKSIVDLHKGELYVKNNDNNQGSIFVVKLLLGRKHLTDEEIIKDFKFSDDICQYVKQIDESIANLEDEIPRTPDKEKLTILVVEDNKPLRRFMLSLLNENYNILEAANGRAAFKIAKKEIPDLIISDVVMPIMAGTELCSAIKGELKTSHIPIILLTSRTSLIYKLEGLESGADDYISKPFDIKEFKTRVKNLLENTVRLKKKFSSTDIFDSNEVVITSVDEKLYRSAIKIVENNIGNEDFDIPYFCSELGVSRTMLFTKVKAWSNFTPNEFIQHFRMKRAALLLEQGKINIAEVSYMVGFKNPKYFSTCFNKKFGQTPTEYANKFSENINISNE
ncbi:hybrid sensor histidine kinase/response regulator transcription factor [Algibacter luteus]|uniref:hybrid sensor histidine kinase/response regulator transcription factor n=1 Tax=Algibacter luteus TaxID=1178825 RepID=UPI001ED92172|nr:two-component regulator propeller domain-containing protein [Algibacter luteus]